MALRTPRFVREHPRDPLPDTLTWETGDPASFNSAHWLVVTSLGKARGEAESLPDLNEMIDPPAPDFGSRDQREPSAKLSHSSKREERRGSLVVVRNE